MEFKKNQIIISITGFEHKIRLVKDNFIYFYGNMSISPIHYKTLKNRINKCYYIIKK